MTISELICLLQAIKCEYGDLPVALNSSTGKVEDIDSLLFEVNGYADGLKYKEHYLYLN